uniref:Putative sodium/potassium-transporting atpase subunit beta-2 isoform x2 n=1 Tax=Xenopsylla cheopis TaxID=163159 RepID=A0A6M2DEM3_XENCH
MSKQQYTVDGDLFGTPHRKKPVPWNEFLYNSEEGTVLGRTGLSWAKIGIFYTIFYGVLAALVAICMWVFFQTLDPRIPKWQLDESIIGTNPGLGFRPLPPDENIESTLIWYKGTDYDNYRRWTKSLSEFLEFYKTPGLTYNRGQNIYSCDYNSPPPKGMVCDVDVKAWGPCIEENNFNYHKSAPCVILKLNKIFGWIPEYYNDTNNLPEKMPDELKNYIKNSPEIVANPAMRNTVWVSCEGENPADVEHIGSVKYYPRRGFPGYYYPYENNEGYLSPLVAVHFERPKTGILINIECKAWAHNIIHDRHDRIGSVHFELMVD